MYTSGPKAPLCPVTVYLCEDTIDGIFTAIYRAWADGTSHTDVRVRTNDTMSLFETYIFSESDGTLARKVQRSIIEKLSVVIYESCFQARLYDDNNKASTLFHFLQKAFRCGSNILNRLNDPDVFRIFELSRTVGHEAHKYLGFVRLEERYEKYAKAQAWLTDSAIVVPTMSSSGAATVISKVVPFSGASAQAGNKGSAYFKYVEVQDEPVTKKQYDEALKKWQKEKVESNKKAQQDLEKHVK